MSSNFQKFDQNSNFSTIAEKISYPLDIYEKKDSIVFELAAVGLDYEDIDIEVQGDVLRIKYAKAKEEEAKEAQAKESGEESDDEGLSQVTIDSIKRAEEEFEKYRLNSYRNL